MRTAVIRPEDIYCTGDLVLLLGITERSLARARRAGRLRFARCGHRVLYRGEWVISWLDEEAERQAKEKTTNVPGRGGIQ